MTDIQEPQAIELRLEETQISAPKDKWERLMQVAIERGGGAEQFAMLVDAMTRARREDARLQFEAALGRFKDHLPAVFKTKKVSYDNKDGSVTTYHHAELDKISAIIAEELRAEGLTHSWRPSEGVNGRTLVTCVFRHPASGHVEDMATLGGPPDTSGGKNSVQAIGSTNYYLERYTLLAASGIVPKGIDTDGVTPEAFEPDKPKMTDERVVELCDAIKAARNDEELKTFFRAAIDEAKKIGDKGDRAAQDDFTKAKNDRYRELHPRKS